MHSSEAGMAHRPPVEIRANKSRALLSLELHLFLLSRDLPIFDSLAQAYPEVGAREIQGGVRGEEARVRPCVWPRSGSLSHSLSSGPLFPRSTSSRPSSALPCIALHCLARSVAAKNCALHFGNVVGMYWVFPFAAVSATDKNGDGELRPSSLPTLPRGPFFKDPSFSRNRRPDSGSSC